MKYQIYTPTDAEREKFYPLFILNWIKVAITRLVEAFKKIDSAIPMDEQRIVREHLIDLVILRLNSFHDDCYNAINTVPRHFPGVRLGPQVQDLMSRLGTGGDLHWILEHRDTFLGHNQTHLPTCNLVGRSNNS